MRQTNMPVPRPETPPPAAERKEVSLLHSVGTFCCVFVCVYVCVQVYGVCVCVCVCARVLAP
jgi:hypothetical protein